MGECFICLDSVSEDQFDKIHTCNCSIVYHTECIHSYLDIPVYTQRCPWCQRLTFRRIYTPEEFEEVRRKILEHARYEERLQRIGMYRQLILFLFTFTICIITIGAMIKS
jgi:hypothetical protein